MRHQPPHLKVWRPAGIEQLELKEGTAISQSFERHAHEEFQLGWAEGDAVEFYCRGAYHVVPPKTLSLIQSGEIHSARSLGDKPRNVWAMFIEPALMQTLASELASQQQPLPVFPSIALDDRILQSQFQTLYRSLTTSESLLERETLLAEFLSRLLQQASGTLPAPRTTKGDRHLVRQIRDYLHEHYAENISLAQLTQIAHASQSHLNRTFSQAIGIPPHRYQMQVRILHAKRLLLQGMPVQQVATDVGFSSQSYFGTYFRRFVGIPPGQYQRDSRA